MKPSYEDLLNQLKSARSAVRVWETTMMQVCGEDGPASVAAEIKALRDLRDTALVTLRSENEELKRKVEALAVENADLKHPGTYLPSKRDTPATDAALADIRNKARAEGIYFTANRLLGAWDSGFIDSPSKEVIDVARMILSAAEMLKDATEGDFSRKFADEIMEEMKPQLSKESGQ